MSMSYEAPTTPAPTPLNEEGSDTTDTASPTEVSTDAPTAAPTAEPTPSLTTSPTSAPTGVQGVQGTTQSGEQDNPAAANEAPGDSSTPGPDVGQTAMIVVLAVAAATVVGALVARKIYTSRSSSNASLSDSSNENATNEVANEAGMTTVDF